MTVKRICSRKNAKYFLKFILFSLFVSLAGCSVYPTGTLVFVTNERNGTISVIDAKNDKIIDTIFCGARPRGIRISADGKNAYVALSAPPNKGAKPEDNRIIVLDTST